MTLFEQVGGQVVVKTAVTVFCNRVTGDPTLAPWFDGVDLSSLRAHQRAFLSAALDGPPVFAGRDLGEAHADMAITDDAFDSIVSHLAITLDDLGVDADIVALVRERLENLRGQIVDK